MAEKIGPSIYPHCKNCPVLKEKINHSGKPLEITGLELKHTSIVIFCRVEPIGKIANVFMGGTVSRVYGDNGTERNMQAQLPEESVECPANYYKVDTPRIDKGVPYRNKNN